VPSPARRNEPVLKAAGQREEDEPLDLDAAMARYQRETRQMLRAADHVAFVPSWSAVADEVVSRDGLAPEDIEVGEFCARLDEGCAAAVDDGCLASCHGEAPYAVC